MKVKKKATIILLFSSLAFVAAILLFSMYGSKPLHDKYSGQYELYPFYEYLYYHYGVGEKVLFYLDEVARISVDGLDVNDKDFINKFKQNLGFYLSSSNLTEISGVILITPCYLTADDFDISFKDNNVYLISKKELKIITAKPTDSQHNYIEYNITPKIKVPLTYKVKVEPVQTRKQDSQPSSDFKFAIASDLHVQSSYVPGKLKKNLEQIISQDPDFVVLTGDLTDADPGQSGKDIDKMWSNFKSGVFDKLTSNDIFIVPALGNHDAYNKYQKDSYTNFWKTNSQSKLEQLINKDSNFPLYYSFDYNNNHFVVLDTNKEYISQGQLNWLENDLSSAKAKHTFVFGHHPLLAPCTTYWCHRSSGLQPSDKLVNLFKKYNITLLTTGHAHYYRKARYKGVNTLLMGSTTYNRKYDKEKQDEMFVMADVGNVVTLTPINFEGKKLKDDWLLPNGYAELSSSVVS
ncbi:hypothetical protein D6777_01435 [Candidatus Woesearchaeota archaeon]|nr:MAG: hypothetical protein D6777_01435 [Candidatus Woesearchaeota archaeon]